MRCNYCEWRCDLDKERYGVCRTYYAEDGVIKERYPNRWSTYSMSRMESLPFYHAYPGARTMTIGTAGCNFACSYCSNAFVARVDPGEQLETLQEIAPQDLIRQALKLDCHNIVFNVNEPTVAIPSLLELKKHAQAAGLPMGCLTNAYSTEEGTQILTEIFDFFNIGLKGITEDFHKDFIGVGQVEPILRNIRTLASMRHLEVTTPVIQGVNDKDLMSIAEFLADIDPEIPWHVFRLLPEHEMKETDYPSIEAINANLDEARKLLKNLYFHNFVGSDWVNTLCPDCGQSVIERISLGCGGDRLDSFNCPDNLCPGCGREIRMHGTFVPIKVRGREVRP